VVLEHSDRWQRHFARALRQDEKVTCELALRRPDGYRLEVRLDCLRRFTSGKAPILRLVLSDITAHKHIEEQLREMATSLEAKVEERTSRLRDLAIELSMTEDRERRLLAKDLHDDLGQLLAIIKIKLTSLEDGASQAQIDRIVELVDKAGQSARMITTRLSPPILHTLGFVPALEWLAEEMELMYGLHVHLAVDCRRINLDDHVQSMLHRSARELLINVARHAGVSDATLSCMCAGRRIMLMVSDDGRGFDPAELPGILTGHRSFGLGSINEHIARIGGHMEIDARPENGTTITLTLPCSTKDEACSNDPDRSCR
jgi:signal transduction histidine kinase